MWGPPVAIAAEISSLYCLRCPGMQQVSAKLRIRQRAQLGLALSMQSWVPMTTAQQCHRVMSPGMSIKTALFTTDSIEPYQHSRVPANGRRHPSQLLGSALAQQRAS